MEIQTNLEIPAATYRNPEHTAKIKESLDAVYKELLRAEGLYSPSHSYHEAFAVLQEEVEELWDEIKKKPANRRKEKIREEAIQTSAMALRLLVDLC